MRSKGHAVACERNHAANDLDAFASFAGRRKYLNRVVSWRLGRPVAFIEKVALELPERARQVTPIPFTASRSSNVKPNRSRKCAIVAISAAAVVASTSGAALASAVAKTRSASLATGTSKRMVGSPIN
jgi:hypothetical protein